jgi:hypothetical protein
MMEGENSIIRTLGNVIMYFQYNNNNNKKNFHGVATFEKQLPFSGLLFPHALREAGKLDIL